MKKTAILFVAMAMLLIFTTMIFASDSAPTDQDGYQVEEQSALPIANMSIDASRIIWEPHVKSNGLVLTISGPNNVYFRQQFVDGVQITLDLLDKTGAALPDGGYNYELYAIPALTAEAQEALTTARENGDTVTLADLERAGVMPQPLMQSGYFTIHTGAFVLPSAGETPADITESNTAQNNGGNTRAPDDQVIYDDLIVDGSICAGFDCVNGESFGFDTIRLKENNLRIKFQDTSSSASFPTNDWQITANDSANGGLNKFSIDDIDGGRTPFTIEASAPSHSLYVDDAGRIGLGTSTPVVEAHIVDGDTPTVRLEQNGSSGFTPQTWDVAGNEAGFFVRDATNGSTLPFRIRPGAPSSSIDIAAGGNVGIGVTAPSALLDVGGNAKINGELDVVGSAEINGILTVTEVGPPQIKLENSDDEFIWTINVNDDGYFVIDFLDNPGDEFVLQDDGTLITSGSSLATQAIKIANQKTEIDALETRLAKLEALVEALLAESNK